VQIDEKYGAVEHGAQYTDSWWFSVLDARYGQGLYGQKAMRLKSCGVASLCRAFSSLQDIVMMS